MQQRVQIFHRRLKPSSGAQLPITAALYAENLTLFADILHHKPVFVNPLNKKRIQATARARPWTQFEPDRLYWTGTRVKHPDRFA